MLYIAGLRSATVHSTSCTQTAEAVQCKAQYASQCAAYDIVQRCSMLCIAAVYSSKGSAPVGRNLHEGARQEMLALQDYFKEKTRQMNRSTNRP
eukprot:1277719-Rhodomonas_salina.7